MRRAADAVARYGLPRTDRLRRGIAMLSLQFGLLLLPCFAEAATRTISFAGLTWNVRAGTGAPGNGCWSDDPASVWVDESGFLHLKIRQLPDGRWCQAQVTAQSYAEYGDHLFWTNSRIDQLADTVVLGLFLYADDYHEIDVEVTRAFGGSNNLHYVVQPYYDGAPRSSFDAPLVLSGGFSSHSFTWSADRSVSFGSWHGHCAAAPCGGVIASWSYTGPNTPLHGELLRPYLNLWIRGAAPAAPQEVVIERYRGSQVPPPGVTTGAAGAISPTGATLAGTVNPNGWSSFGWFEYGTSTDYGSTTESSRQPVGEGSAATPISKAVSGLRCGTTYHFRGVARNVAGTAYGADSSFIPLCPAPVVTTGEASQVGESAATLGGTVNPNGASAATGFEYGPTTSYGGFLPAQPLSGTTVQPISATASSLRCGVTYHFRARASHAGGTGYGPDASFSTAPCSGKTPRWRPVRPGG